MFKIHIRNPLMDTGLKLDHSINIGNGKLESGYQFRSDSQDGNFDYIVTPEDLNQPNWIVSGEQQFPKIRLIRFTASIQPQVKSWSTLWGCVMNIHTEQLNYLSTHKHMCLICLTCSRRQICYIPLQPDLKLKAGFSRRIQRSTNNQLNPIPEREHSETLEMGDPDLKPEFVSLAELGLTKTFNDGGSVFVTAYLQDSKDPVQRVNSIYADTILNRVYTNVEKGRSVGFEVGADFHPTKWWALFFGGNVFNQSYKGTL